MSPLHVWGLRLLFVASSPFYCTLGPKGWIISVFKVSQKSQNRPKMHPKGPKLSLRLTLTCSIFGFFLPHLTQCAVLRCFRRQTTRNPVTMFIASKCRLFHFSAIGTMETFRLFWLFSQRYWISKIHAYFSVKHKPLVLKVNHQKMLNIELGNQNRVLKE